MQKHKNPVPIPDGYVVEYLSPQQRHAIAIHKGKYLTPEIVNVGDMVLTVFTVGTITSIYQSNYLPRFVLRDKSGKKYRCGKTKLRGKLVKT